VVVVVVARAYLVEILAATAATAGHTAVAVVRDSLTAPQALAETEVFSAAAEAAPVLAETAGRLAGAAVGTWRVWELPEEAMAALRLTAVMEEVPMVALYTFAKAVT